MKFAEYFGDQSGPVISFELFPPKTDAAMAQLGRVLPRLVALEPSFMTVTYGAFGSTQERTLEIAAGIKRDHGIETASHLTCVGSTREQIDSIVSSIRSSGLENIVALRGDPPAGETEFVAPEGGFAHANELVTHLSAHHDVGIAVAGYPETHVEAPDAATDLANLVRKVDAGADVVITQLFYDNRDFFAFVERAREAGIRVPIVPGILPIQSLAQIQRIAGLCGAKIPAELERDLEAAADDADKVRSIGVEWAIAQCKDLLARGAPGIHFYVLNRSRHMEAIMAAIR